MAATSELFRASIAPVNDTSSRSCAYGTRWASNPVSARETRRNRASSTWYSNRRTAPPSCSTTSRYGLPTCRRRGSNTVRTSSISATPVLPRSCALKRLASVAPRGTVSAMVRVSGGRKMSWASSADWIAAGTGADWGACSAAQAASAIAPQAANACKYLNRWNIGTQ